MLRKLCAPTSMLIGAVLLAGCSSDGAFLGTPLTTSSISDKIDPVCVSLTAEIDGLVKEGVAEKVEKAAAKKYRLKPADLAKADKLNKANAEFQNRCALNPTKPAETTASAPADTAKPAESKQAAAAEKSAGEAAKQSTKAQ